jgi:hypothetical protein
MNEVTVALVALVATIWLGLFTYWQNARNTRLMHMHKLFGDYLDHEFNFQIAQTGADSLEDAKASLSAFKMYSLEEMWLWLNSEWRPWFGPKRKARHDRSIRGWTNTIEYHIKKGDAVELHSFLTDSNCYSPEFVALVLDHHPARKDPALAALVADVRRRLPVV